MFLFKENSNVYLFYLWWVLKTCSVLVLFCKWYKKWRQSAQKHQRGVGLQFRQYLSNRSFFCFSISFSLTEKDVSFLFVLIINWKYFKILNGYNRIWSNFDFWQKNEDIFALYFKNKVIDLPRFVIYMFWIVETFKYIHLERIEKRKNKRCAFNLFNSQSCLTGGRVIRCAISPEQTISWIFC